MPCKTINCVGDPSYSEFCSFCLLRQDNEKMLWRIKQIEDPSVSDEQISSMFESAEFKSTLDIYTIQDHLDAVLFATYERSHTLLQNLVSIMQQNQWSKIYLSVCMHYHFEPKLCKMFTHMHEKKMFENGPHLTRCLTCFISEITRTDGLIANIKTQEAYVAKLWRYIYNFVVFRRHVDTLSCAYETMVAVADSSKVRLEYDELYEIAEKLREAISSDKRYSLDEVAEVFDKLHEHPMFMSRHTKNIKKYMKNHTAAWKLDWLAKALHPSRAWAWCCDTEEQDELKRAGIMC